MITEEQYLQAVKQHEEAGKIIKKYHSEQLENFEKRMKENPIFTDDELCYSAITYCHCGHGLAYPKGCGINHYWDCSAKLKGIDDPTKRHTAQLPFAYYEIKIESEHNGTTRGKVKL